MYRLWRDLGYAFGAIVAGVAADLFGLPASMSLVAALTFASGVVVAIRMREDLHRTMNGASASRAASPDQERAPASLTRAIPSPSTR